MNIQEFERKLDYCLKKLNKESDLDWIEIRDELGLDCSGDHLRKLSYAYKEYHEYIQAKGVDSISNEMYDKLLEKEYEVKKLMTKLSDLRTLVNKDSREQARYEQLLDMLRKEIRSIEPTRERVFEEVINNRKEVICCLSDIHYGINIENNWNKFDSEIAYRRMYKMMMKTVEAGKSNGCDIAHLLITGDVVNNNIHLSSRMSNRETITQQIVGVSELISQAIYCLQNDFKYVMVHICSGNHDRILPNKNENDYEDNFVSIIKEFIKLRTNEFKNVIFNENEYGHDIVKFNVCGKSIIGTHGDKIPNNQAISRFSSMFGNVDYVIQGHYHHNIVNSVGDSKVLTIGSFSGADGYSREKGLICNPTQKILILEDGNNDEILYEIDLSNR